MDCHQTPLSRLEEVVQELDTSTLIEEFRKLVSAIWCRNVDRYEPEFGDTPMSLGIQCAENFRVQALRIGQEFVA